MEYLVLAAVVLVLVLLNGVFVAAEFALLSVPPTQLERLAKEHKWAARMLHTLQDTRSQDRYIAVAQVGISLASLGLGMYGEHALADALVHEFHMEGPMAHGLATAIALAVLTYLHIVVGEMVPKSMALMHPLVTARWLELPMTICGWILGPLVWILNHLGNLVLRVLGLPVSQELSLVYSPEELRLVFEESHEEGLLQGEQHEWLQSLLDLRERSVRQVMVARTRVVGLPVEAGFAEAMELVRDEGYTRYPVYEKDLDHIVGVVHVRDLYGAARRGTRDVTMRDLMRLMPYLPESMHLDQVLERMRAEKAHLAVVVDEHGGTGGIVTLEDLVEEIFGEVFDEFDVEEGEPIAELGSDEWSVEGDVLLEDLSETLDRELQREEIETVSGLVLDLLQRPPVVGDRVEWQGVSFEVEEVADMAALRCRVRRGPAPEPPPPVSGAGS